MADTRKGFSGAVMISLLLIIGGILFFSYTESDAEKNIHINEVMTNNLSAVSDNRGGHPDWTELYNSSGQAVNLKGFRLRTGERGSEEFIFPEVELKPGAYLIVYMSEKYLSDIVPENPDSKFSVKNYIFTGRGTGSAGLQEEAAAEGTLYAPFNISSDGTRIILCGKAGNPLEEVDVPGLRYNTSFARVSDGKGEFKVLSPSPGSSNDRSEALVIPSEHGLELSHESGFYDEPFELEIRDDRESEIYYTTDGSDPIKNGRLYSGPIKISDNSSLPNMYAGLKETSCFFVDPTSVQIEDEKHYKLPSENVDKAVVIRATSCGEDGSFSEVNTRVYFIGYKDRPQYEGLPIMSLVTDPDSLFGYEKGIYVTGKAMDDYLIRENEDNVTPWDDANYRNRGAEWEREAVMSYFDGDRSLKAQQNVGIRIKGNWSRAYPQKSLNIYARKEYGSETFDTVFFSGDKYESVITMFNGGNDATYKLEDVIAADLAAGKEAEEPVSREEALSFSVMRHYPCFLFLNGEYWGIMDLSEKFDEDYIVRQFGVRGDNVVMIKNLELEEGEEEDIELYDQLRYLVYTGEFEKQENYGKFCEAVDIDSFLDYYAFRIYMGNRNDWPARNFALWRTREPEEGVEYGDCRWRFMLFDVNNKSMDPADLEEGFDFVSYVREGDNMFDELMKNPGFEKLFYERLEELSETNCSPETVRAVVENRRNIMELPMEGWYRRFTDDAGLIAMFNGKADRIEEFFTRRKEGLDKLKY
ncbi:MAG: CotH kinase family protein [Lachnospiraceae bacterium]|nr:CotH kinase family protein [Lachnospiraceae bacterium]